jgi:multidrug efflux system outer membrane protein
MMGNTIVPGRQASAGANISQPLFRKGFFASRAAGRSAYESAGATLARAREELAHDVALVFIDVVRTRSLLETSRGAVVRTQAQYEHAVARVKGGNALKSAELLAQVDVKRAERQVVSAQLEIGRAEAAFRRLVGRTPPRLAPPPLPAIPPPPQGLEAAKRRDDLQALHLQVRSAEEEQDAAAGRRWWPRLDLEASVQYVRPDPTGVDYDWRVIGLLTIPILQSGRELTEVALRENNVRIAQLQLEQQRKLVVEEVEAGALAVASTAQSEDLANKQLTTAQEHYKLVDKGFRLGAITFLEVTVAQSALAEAERAFEIARIERVRAVYDYMFAIGAIDLEAP